jgi:hypothetical protein
MSVCVDYKKLTSGAVVIGVGMLLALIKYRHLTLGFNYDTLSAAGTVAAVTWFLWGVFKRWLWKLPFLQGWLVKIPNLNGTWTGEMQSTWVDPETNAGIPPIPTTATITQTLTTITVDFQTGEMESQSVVADISCDSHRRIAEIKYIYQSEPDATVRSRSEMHYGSAKLAVKTGGGVKKLKGDYWTDRKTTGTISLKKA